MSQPTPESANPAMLSKGDSLAKVKEVYEITFDPETLHTPSSSFFYHFREYGVTIFFDTRLLVTIFRFDKPFAGKIGDISISDHKDKVIEVKGTPTRKFKTIPVDPLTYWIYTLEKDGFIRYDINDKSGMVETIFSTIAPSDAVKSPVHDTKPVNIPDTPNTLKAVRSGIPSSKPASPPLPEEPDPLRRAYREAGNIIGWYECYRKLKARITYWDAATNEREILFSLPPFEQAAIETENHAWENTTPSLGSLSNVAHILMCGCYAEQRHFGEKETRSQSRLMGMCLILDGGFTEEIVGEKNPQLKEASDSSWKQQVNGVTRTLDEYWPVIETLVEVLQQQRSLPKTDAFRIIDQWRADRNPEF